MSNVDKLAALAIDYLRLLNLPLGLLMNFGGETFREGLRRVMNDRRAALRRLAPPSGAA